jgi:hypothetical protein
MRHVLSEIPFDNIDGGGDHTSPGYPRNRRGILLANAGLS